MLTQGSEVTRLDGGSTCSQLLDSEEGCIVVPVFTDKIPEQALLLAVTLAEQANNDLVIVGMDAVPEQTPLDHPEPSAASQRRSEAYVKKVKSIGPSSLKITGDTLVGHDLGHMILKEVDVRNAEGVVLIQTEEESTSASSLRNPLNSVVESGECDVIVVNRPEYLDDISSILVPVAGGPHSGLAVDVAKKIAIANKAWIDLFHVVDSDAPNSDEKAGQQYIDAALERTGDYEKVDTWLHEASDVSEAIIEQSAYYDLTVLGSPQKGRLKQFIFGSTTDVVRDKAESAVVTVRAEDTEKTWFEYWLGKGN